MAKLIKIPGTEHVCLDGDNCIGRMCVEMGTLSCQKWMEQVPEISARLQRGSVVLDIGAYIGDTTRMFLDHRCEVYAFECMSDALSCLHHNCPDAKIIPRPVGDGRSVSFADHSEIQEEVGNFGGRFVTGGEGQPTFRLDDLSLTKCDFIKIDVEGAEPMVLDGAKRLISGSRPLILAEFVKGASARFGYTGQIEDLILRLPGYRWRQINGNIASMCDILFLP